jgi:hypothetical protein
MPRSAVRLASRRSGRNVAAVDPETLGQIIPASTAVANTRMSPVSVPSAARIGDGRVNRVHRGRGREAGLDVPELVRRITEDRVILEMLTRAMDAVARREQTDRAIGVRRAVAQAMSTDETATVVASHLIVRAIAELNTPHVTVLARIGVPDVSLDLMPGRIDVGQMQLLYLEARLALGTLVAPVERQGLVARDPRTGGPSFVRSGVDYLRTDFGREVLAVLGQPE